MENTYNELYEKLARLQWLLGRHHMQNHMERGPFADPTRGQGRVLAMLKMQPEISTKDLSYLLGIRQQSLNELLNKLERAGYILREPAEKDRRIIMVKLTEKSKTQQQTGSAGADYSNIFSCLSAEEQEAFGDYLDRVTAALEEQFGAGGNEEDMAHWMRAARERMGDETFEQMMSMRGGFGRHGRGPHGPGPWGDFGPGNHRRHPHEHGKHPGGPKGPHHRPEGSTPKPEVE